MITGRQRALFFGLLARAAQARGLSSPADREAYRKAIMREEAGADHLADLDCHGFDAVAKRFAADAEDWEQASRFAVGDDVRLQAVLNDMTAQVLSLTGAVDLSTMDYLAGVARQARLPTPSGAFDWDLSARDARRLLSMLDTHRRRLLRRHGAVEAGIRLAYQYGRRWHISPGGELTAGAAAAGSGPPVTIRIR